MNTFITGGNRRKSTFPSYNLGSNCEDAPDNVIFYDGTELIPPTLQCGNIYFPGARTCVNGRGSGYTDGFMEDQKLNDLKAFHIPFHDILSGGAGARIRCCTEPLAKRVRFRCCDIKCSSYTGDIYLKVRPIETCQAPVIDNKSFPYVLSNADCCLLGCCEKINKLASMINEDPNGFIWAAVVNVGVEYFLDITSRNPESDFYVEGSEGLGEMKVVVPFHQQRFNLKNVQTYLCGDDITTGCDPDECLLAIELWWYHLHPYRDGSTQATSSLNIDRSKYITVVEYALVVFKQAAETSFNELVAILTANDEYHKKLCDQACHEGNYNLYCISVEDAGDEAALTNARASNVDALTLDRSAFKNGVSYYTAYYKATDPQPTVTEEAGPGVKEGCCTDIDRPCNDPSTCPQLQSSCCGGCIETVVTPTDGPQG